MQQKLKHQVFWIPFGLLLISTILSIVKKDWFLTQVTNLKNWIMVHFDDWFFWVSFLCLVLLIIVFFSPIAKLRIGGKDAKPLLSKWRWFAITLCTTIATGILFWGTAEPIYHLHQPPANLGIEAGSAEAQQFAMSTMFMHWTFTPYAIYGIIGLLFALTYYNLGQSFSLGTLLYPLLGDRAKGSLGHVIDIICLFALVAGMAASLGAGILSISGGLNQLFGWEGSGWMYGMIALLIVLSFLISAHSGLFKGIRLLSDYNIRAFIILSILIFFWINPLESLQLGGKGLVDYFQHFLNRSTNISKPLDTAWQQSWTVFYWANWMAWAPISALFLGRIAYGYTVRQFILVNVVFTAIFGGIWMMIFSGASLHQDIIGESFPLYQSLQTNGPESIIYLLFEMMPFSKLISFIFLFIVFLSFVTASDSNTSAMSGISTVGISPENAEAPFFIKMLWGITIGLVAWIMISFAGIDGIKTISAIGGFPVLILMILILISWIKILFKKDFFTE